MILSVMEWFYDPVRHGDTDHGTPFLYNHDGQDHKDQLYTVYDPVRHYKDPVRHGMSYPDSDRQDHKLSVMVL